MSGTDRALPSKVYLTTPYQTAGEPGDWVAAGIPSSFPKRVGLDLEVGGESALGLLTPCKENLRGLDSHLEGSAKKASKTSLPLFHNPHHRITQRQAGSSCRGGAGAVLMKGSCMLV